MSHWFEPPIGFSIVIPVHNGGKTLADTLHSVNQVEHEKFEVIVVDDGSTDDTCAIAEEHGARVVRMAKNSGPAAARNQGALHAVHAVILFTDSDVWVPKHLLKLLEARFVEKRPDAIQGTFSEVCPFANYCSQYKNLYNRFALNRLPDWIDTTFTSITAVARSSFHACGGFDENIREASIEDRTLGRNLTQHGFSIYLDRALEVVHNKKLTLKGFMRNQFRRSRDLAKLMLRNRCEDAGVAMKPDGAALPKEDGGRFGTNAPNTMARIPAAFMVLGLCALGMFDGIFFAAAGMFFGLFFYLSAPFHWDLLLKRGLVFSAKGIPLNFADAVVSGMGILVGLFEYFLLRKRY